MKKYIIRSSLVLAVAVPGAAHAAGFQINEHAAGATGRAGAVFATVNDATSVFYNPAGLTGTTGTVFQAGVALIMPSGTYTGTGLPSTNPSGAVVSQSAKSSPVPVPHAYVSHQLSEKAFVGFGFYAPYGLGINWVDGDDFVGRTVVKDLSLRSFFLTPTVALKLSENISFALSVSLVPATLGLTRTLGASDNGQVLFPVANGTDGEIELAGSAFGVGANAGIQVTLIEKLKLGLAYRSAVGLSFDGQADFRVPSDVPVTVAANFEDGAGGGSVTLPHSFAFGVGWADSDFTVEASANLTLWNSYDELRIQFASGRPAPFSVAPRNWSASPTFRLGGEYRFLGRYTARLGAAYDINAAPDNTVDPTLPDQDRIIFTAGFGTKFDWFTADLGYMGLFLPRRDIPDDNVNFRSPTGGDFYESRLIHVLGLTLGFAFET